MSTEANQPELQNGAVAPEPATPSERDPDLHPPKASAIQSDDLPPAADDAVNSNSNAVQSNEVQSADAEDSQPHRRSVQSGDTGALVTSVSDPKIQDPEGRTSLSSGTADGDGKLARTFTMRELLDELKKDDRNEEMQAGSPQSQDSMQQHLDQSNAAMDLINKVTGTDEEGQSRQRILTYAAKRYANAIERNPNDFDALYNWALILQESADNVSPGSSSTSRDALLEEACKKYEEATHICPTLYDAYYNWSIAISDRAKMRGRTKEAEELWKQASRNYEKAVQLNWNSPQAFNNWGLALQELSAIVPAREKPIIVKAAINKFRGSIKLQFDFHRAIYNLGTVLYGLAEDTARTGGSVIEKELSHDELYSLSAVYIAAAYALKQNTSIYFSALKLVRSMLPLPFLKVGYLTAPPAGNPIAPHIDWKRSQFVLNHEVLLQVNKSERRDTSQSLSSLGDTSNASRAAIRVNIPDIVSVSACADLTLPPGAGLWIETTHGPIFLVADSWEFLEGWLDAIRLVYTIFARGKSDVLAGIITG